MMLSRELFARVNVSPLLKYATLAVLFVNVSIGGTLTSYAAPPVLMVAQAWGWDSAFMLKTFGWKAALAVTINAVLVTMVFGRQLLKLDREGSAQGDEGQQPVPLALVLTHLAFLVMVVVLAHHPVLFIGLFLFFMGVVTAYGRHQDRLILREGLLVGFFLAGLVVLGGQQQWWLKPVLTSLSSDAVFWGAMGLTAFTDNAALTYLGSLVDGLSPEFKVALVAGAVTGGGMTVIANAPNPAGAVNPGILALAAAIPTFVAAMAFQLP
jgi:Na+/H+ antiporter NhaD/arsenite permease-like protein